MGIPFKLYEGKEVNLPAELTAGGIYFCEDSGNVFIDVDIDGTLTRVPLGKKYVDDQLVDIREFIENQGSGIEISDSTPTKPSANVWINTSDEDEEGVEYLGVVTSINGKGGDVNITASDIDAAEKTHAAQHASGGSDPITPEVIGAIKIYRSLTELGLTEATATPEAIVETMDNYSILLYKMSSTATTSALVTPRNYMLLTVTKLSPGYAEFTLRGWGSDEILGYYGYYNSGNTPAWHGWIKPLRSDSDTMTGEELWMGNGYSRLYGSVHGTSALNLDVAKDKSNFRGLLLQNATRVPNMATALKFTEAVNGNETQYPIFHSGNKPSHYYRGTGGAWTESLNTGGIGDMIFISKDGADVFAIVTREGALVKDAAGTVRGISRENVNFKNGALTMNTSDDALNTANWRYNYQVL